MAEINKPDNLSYIWADTGEKRQPSNAKILTGWVAEIPTFQDFNWLDGRQDHAIAHINQHGIAMWDAQTEYQANKSYVMASDGSIYEATQTSINVEPTANPTHWRVAFWGSRNTTVDTNGFIKEASPIVRLFSDHIKANDEAQDVKFYRVSEGYYKLETQRDLASSGWAVEVPKDFNGNILVYIEIEKVEDGFLVSTFKPSYKNGKAVAGSVSDIPDGRWVDLRLSYLESEIQG